MTLGDLDRENKLLWLYCNDCGLEREVEPLSIGLPAEQSVPTASARLRCSKRGSRKITSRPKLYSGGLKRAPKGSRSMIGAVGKAFVGLIGVAIGAGVSQCVQWRIAKEQRKNDRFVRQLNKLEEMTETLIALRGRVRRFTREFTEQTVTAENFSYLPSTNELDRLRALAKLYAQGVLKDLDEVEDYSGEINSIVDRALSKEIEIDAMVREIGTVNDRIEVKLDQAIETTAQLARSLARF